MSYLSTAVLALSLALPATTVFPAVPATAPGIGAPAPSVQQAHHVYIGPDGEPLPFENDEAIVDFLRTADIIERTEIDTGINQTWKLLMDKDGVRAHAIFREVDFVEENHRVGPIFFLFFRDSYIFDCAAYEMAVLLGMDNVPPAILRRVERTDGSVQLWIEGTHRVDAADFHPPGAVAWARQLWTMSLFDALIYNVDRNSGNLMADDDYKLWLIDHGRGFQRKSDLLNIDQVPMVDRRIWERLRDLDEATIRAAMGDYLASEEVAYLLERHRKLVEHINKRIEELGELSVLF